MDEGCILHTDIACSCAFSTTQALYCHGVCAGVGIISGPGTIVSPIVCMCSSPCIVCFVCCHPLVGRTSEPSGVYVCVALTQSCIRHRIC